ncbi:MULTISPECIES: DUF6049 family protein [unclassified Leucobacter]|uniref:DUF6049 family protein n=1 Tax=unclassified Leucobacter TaxID=2621730 RepID=UPI00069BEEA8|nr:DUF6049 family protein [Leucobacter sp. Ag1]
MPCPPAARRRTRPRSGALARLVRASAAVLGVTIALVGGPASGLPLGGPAGASAHADETSDSTSDATSAAKPELVVAPAEPVIRDDAASVVFHVLVRNATQQDLPAGGLELRIDPKRIASAGALADGLAPPKGSGTAQAEAIPGSVLATQRIDPTSAGNEQTVSVTVRRSDLAILLGQVPGVFAVHASFTPDSAGTGVSPSPSPSASPLDPSTASGRSLADRLDASAPVVWRGVATKHRTALTVIVPFLLPSTVTGMPTRGQLGDAAARLTPLLDAAERHQSTLAIDPRLIAAIRGLGSQAPQSARELLARLEASTLPQFLLQFADADPAAQAALGSDRLLEPNGLGYYTATAPSTGSEDSSGQDQSSDDTAPTADPAAAPTLDELVAWPNGSARAWPADGQADASTLALLQHSGSESVVLDSSNVSLTGGPAARIDGMQSLVADAQLGASVRGGLAATTEAERGADTAEAAARLALLAAPDGTAGSTVLALDRRTMADDDHPEEVFEVLDTLSWVSPVRETAQVTGTATLRSQKPAQDRLDLLKDAIARESAVTDLAPLLARPESLGEYQRVRLLALLSTSGASPEADFAKTASDYRARDAKLLNGVTAIRNDHTQLVGASTRVPVLLRNDLPFDAVVTVAASPASAAISVPTRSFPRVEIPANSGRTMLIPVDSRISSGESGLIVDISPVGGSEVTFTGTLPLTIRSVVETVALSVLGGLAALLLGFGIWRSIRRRRRAGISEAPEEFHPLNPDPESENPTDQGRPHP